MNPLSTLRQLRKRRRTRRAAQELVTPYAGFILSDHYLSDELESQEVLWLNARSRRLTSASASKIAPGSTLYVQVDQLESFVDDLLPRISVPFVLISGKVGLPGLQPGRDVDALLDSPLVIRWFSHNQVFSDLPIAPFPYGVELRTVSTLAGFLANQPMPAKSKELFVPHAAIHPHLEGIARQIREGLRPHMHSPLKYKEYLREIASHRFVVSPPGDRFDTYRHWECVAVGSFPVSQLPDTFQYLFDDSMVFVDDLVGSLSVPLQPSRQAPDPSRATVAYWRAVIDDAKAAAR